MTAKDMFKEAYGGVPNLITPDIVARTLMLGFMAVEISSGVGIMGGLIYGVTFVEKKGDRCIPRKDLDAVRYSREDAEKYIKEVRRRLRKEIENAELQSKVSVRKESS